MNKRRPHLWLSVLLALSAGSLAVAETTLKDNAREYLALRQTLNATSLTPAQAAGSRSQWRGRNVELFGRVIGRTNACTASAQTPITFMLQVPGVVELVMIDSGEDSPLIAVDQVLHVLAEMPGDARPTDHFVVKALISEGDLPADEQKYDAADQAARVNPAPVTANTNAAAPPDKDDKTAALPDDNPPDNAGAAPPQEPLSRPGTKMPQLAPSVAKGVTVWKRWVAGINSKLTDSQLELIVRSVLYYSALHGVDHRLAFAMIKCESDFDPRCLSHAGAAGLCQLMPGTARGLGVDPWNLEQNINGGIKYLSYQFKAYASRSNYDQFALGMASYNAGPGAVKRAGGVPNIPETVRYVKKVGDLFYELYKSGMP